MSSSRKTMLAAIFSVAGLGFSTPCNAITIQTGDVVTIELAGLSKPFYPIIQLFVTFGSDFLDPGESFDLSYYSNATTLQDGPITYAGSISGGVGFGVGSNNGGNLGHYLLSNVLGPFELTSIMLGGYDGTLPSYEYAEGRVSVQAPNAVPLPAALPLLIGGLAGLGFLKRRGRRKTAA